MSIEARGRFSAEQVRKEILGAVAASALHRMLAGEGSPDPNALLTTLAPVLQDRHLLLYSTDPSVQATLDRLGFTGALPEPDDDTIGRGEQRGRQQGRLLRGPDRRLPRAPAPRRVRPGACGSR